MKNNWKVVQNLNLNSYQMRHLINIAQCHTEAMGGVQITCKDCSHLQYKYYSCRNRHCPSCQGGAREKWIIKQQKYLLDVPYYHVVFTLPSELRPLCMAYPRLIYTLLFKASWETISTLAKDTKYLDAEPGMTAVLHTWSQNLGLHPHLHCIIPGGGRTKNGNWKATRSKGKYLFPAKVMADIFRAIFLRELKIMAANGDIPLDTTLREKLYHMKWRVYAKRPFLNPSHVIEYLGRYTHKIAISNYRIIEINNTHVIFNWKDYRNGGITKPMKLTIAEFVRRFAMHILPHRFVRIRHYGILSYHGRSKKIPDLQKKQGFIPKPEPVVNRDILPTLQCAKCNSQNIRTTELPKVKMRAP